MAPHHFLLILTSPKTPAIQVNGSFMTLKKTNKNYFCRWKDTCYHGCFSNCCPACWSCLGLAEAKLSSNDETICTRGNALSPSYVMLLACPRPVVPTHQECMGGWDFSSCINVGNYLCHPGASLFLKDDKYFKTDKMRLKISFPSTPSVPV
jgi:hypothetical protein